MNQPIDFDKYIQETGNVYLAFYARAAEILGIKHEIIWPSYIIRCYHGDKRWDVVQSQLPINSITASIIAQKKHLTTFVCKKAGLPVPIQSEIHSPEQALEFYKEHKEVVFKPVKNFGGKGITLLPRTEEEAKQAYETAYQEDHSTSLFNVLGEKFFTGSNYRLLVLDGKVLAVAERIPAKVIGDGVNTIEQLIIHSNEERVRQKIHRIKIDQEMYKKLQNDGVTMQDIPHNGEEVILRYNSNLSTGGTTRECTQSTHDYYKQVAINAVKAVGLKLSGVDLIVEDITKEGPCIINELNDAPGLNIHYKPTEGEVLDVAIPIMEYVRENAF
ncbi:ATP-grasp domain-containing protein [Candidatus Dojkabacteria bacterium]|uniref:ATP-grasp domain-containing protein n=1 Tax=Candidatus Dojkabacteria bacterium TaxID=2099670 RepID=A0A955HWR9_9BACT|nr:ATP-grasp domain-containing protein [Candidatus Dojkabacteria bacterium]